MSSTSSKQYFGKDLEAMALAKNYYDWVLSQMLPYLGKCVAEVGAGAGSFSRYLLGTPVECLHAFEPSENMYPLLAQELRCDKRAKAVHGYFEKERGTASYDSILYINVLEHIEDDARELSVAHAALTPKGSLIIFVPALEWLYSDFDKKVGHYRRYSKKDLVTLVEQAGFSVIKANYLDGLGILPWFINFVLLKRGMSHVSVTIYDKLIVPVVRMIESKLPPFVGKNILLIAQK